MISPVEGLYTLPCFEIILEYTPTSVPSDALPFPSVIVTLLLKFLPLLELYTFSSTTSVENSILCGLSIVPNL